jgi:hypothetical protein
MALNPLAAAHRALRTRERDEGRQEGLRLHQLRPRRRAALADRQTRRVERSGAFAQPTGYNLGKSGWVTSVFASGEEKPPVGIICDWIYESYGLVAPKKLRKQITTR